MAIFLKPSSKRSKDFVGLLAGKIMSPQTARNEVSRIVRECINIFEPSPLLGCSPLDFCCWLSIHLEPGMYWSNYGTEWHIGHRMPCRQFDLTDLEELKECYHYTNLRPEWADDNFRRGASWDLGADLMDERMAKVRHLMGNGPDPDRPFSELARLVLAFMGDRLIDRAGNSVPVAKRDSL